MALNKAKTALVTGASSGIGYELTKLLARDGYGLVLVSSNRDKLTRVAKEVEDTYQVPVRVIVKDLSQADAAKEVFEELERDAVSVDVLINNAGFGGYGYFYKTDLTHELNMIQCNVVSIVQLTKLFLHGMITRGSGRVMNVASTAAFQPGPLMTIYYATKAFVLSFSEALSSELNGTGVSVTALCPGPTKTEFGKRAGIDRTRLLNMGISQTADVVAKKGYRGLMKGTPLVIPGIFNKLGSFSLRFMPRRLVPFVVKKVQKEVFDL